MLPRRFAAAAAAAAAAGGAAPRLAPKFHVRRVPRALPQRRAEAAAATRSRRSLSSSTPPPPPPRSPLAAPPPPPPPPAAASGGGGEAAFERRIRELESENERVRALLRQAQGERERVQQDVLLQTRRVLRQALLSKRHRRRLALEREAANQVRASLNAFFESQALQEALTPELRAAALQASSEGDAAVAERLLPVLLAWFREASEGGGAVLDSATRELLDLTLPHEWFPLARERERRIFAHVGPTNSGKTHAALERLKAAGSGVYCGPLRLLAWEVHERLNAAGVACNLLTGQEEEAREGARHVSCTVEMADVGRRWDVAVIDEFQMIGAADRGHAWTRAFLGLAADELHVCGDPSMLRLLTELCAVTGDKLDVSEYSRLSPLSFGPALGGLERVRRGDCVVTFSRREIHGLKREIERKSMKKCCVVYGSLPPETRRAQAELFNAADNDYDVLVASDAIGMGLNLNIRRIIFASLDKFDGDEQRTLSSSEVRQIAGRAGRFRSEFPNGEMTCVDDEDLDTMRDLFMQPPPRLRRAALFPSFEIISRYVAQHPNVPLARVLDAFANYAAVDGLYFLADVESFKAVADALQPLPLALRDRITFCMAPVSPERDAEQLTLLVRYASAFCEGRPVALGVRMPFEGSVLPSTPHLLRHFEAAHAYVDIYLWLARRFPDSFAELDEARKLRVQLSEVIQQALESMSDEIDELRSRRRARARAMRRARLADERESRRARSRRGRSRSRSRSRAARRSRDGWSEDDEE